MMSITRTQSHGFEAGTLRGLPEPEAARLRALLHDFSHTLTRVRKDACSDNSAGSSKSNADKLAQIERLAETYTAAIQLRLQGVSLEKINATLNIRSASRWCSGRVPRFLLNLDPQYRRHLEKPISLPEQPSVELAFILGVFCGKSGVAGRYRGFSIHSREPALVEKLAADFKTVFGIAGTIRNEQYGGVRYHHLWIGSNCLGRYFEQATQKNRTVPLRELPDHHCRRAFLQGFFTACGSAIRPQRRKIHVVKSRNRSMLDAVAVLLKREGVLATVNGQRRAELLIQDQNELARFRELGILSSAADVLALDTICSRRPMRRMFTTDEYRVAMEIAHANTALSPSELSSLISDQTGGRVIVDKSVLRQWRGTTKPECQRRLEKILAIESSLRATPMARNLHREHVQKAQMLREPSKVLPLLREIAWLAGEQEHAFPLTVSTLEEYRAVFERLNLPFTAAHEHGWHQRCEISNQTAAIARLSMQISVTRAPDAMLGLLRERLKSIGKDASVVPAVLPTLSNYRDLFASQNLQFNESHECGWHEATDASIQLQKLSTIASGVHSLVRRQWDSTDAWIKEMPSSSAARCWRTFDGLIDGRRVLQRDLIELLSALGLARATPAMAWLVGLSIAPELQVISQLVCTMRQVREALYNLLQWKDWSAAPCDTAKVQIYRLLPGISLCSLHQNAAVISKYLAQPFTGGESACVDEETVLDWLDHIPKYRSRLGMLTEIARKAQQAGLDPRWAVARSISDRSK